MKKLISILLCLCMFLPCIAFAEETASEEKAVITVDEAMMKDNFVASNDIILPYRLYVPKDYNPEKEYSFLLFLHGAGNRGDDNANQISVNMGMTERIINGETVIYNGEEVDLSREFIIVAPQCAKENQWVDTPWGKSPDPSYSVDEIPQSKYMTAVVELIDKMEEAYNIDENRMYITGLSMGGFGTWDLLMRYPDKWAAAIPMGGGADLSKADILKDIPIWTFHQLLDPTVLSQGTQNIVKEVTKLGGNIKFTPYFEATHNAWKKGYAEEDLLTWTYSHTKDTNPKAGESKMKNVSEALRGEVALSYAVGLIADDLLENCGENITRQQFCKAVLPIISAVPERKIMETFEDTDNEHVARAYAFGIIKGVSDTQFEPDRYITREEMAVIFSRIFALMKNVVAENVEFNAPDVDAISDWAKDAVALSVAQGITFGDEKGNINPKNNTTCEEALAMIYRAYVAVNTYGALDK